MANPIKSARHPSALKHHRQSEERRLRNRMNRGKLKATVKEQNALLETGNVEEAQKQVAATVRAVDKAASKGVIHKNAAARRKSRLQKRLNTLTQSK